MNVRKQKEFEEFKTLYKEGLNDVEISKRILVHSETVRCWRKRLKLLTNFSYESFKTIDYSLVEKMVFEGRSDLEISNILKCSENSIYNIRKKLCLNRKPLNVNEPILFTNIQKQILFGCLLGDGSLRKCKKSLNASFTCSHSLKQKDYNLLKAKFLEPYSKYKEYLRKKPDKRNGVFYSESTFRIGSNKSLNEFYEMFYKEGLKIIPIEYLNIYYTPLALAIHYLDDGTKEECGYSLATMCFEVENIKQFQKFLKEKYNIITSLRTNKTVYIKACSKKLFTDLISKYVPKTMEYKLHIVT